MPLLVAKMTISLQLVSHFIIKDDVTYLIAIACAECKQDIIWLQDVSHFLCCMFDATNRGDIGMVNSFRQKFA